MDRVDKVGEEFFDVGGQLGDDVVFSELFFTDFIGFLLSCCFVQVSKGVDIFVEEDVEDIGFQECFVGLKDSSERCFVHDDDVGGNRVICPDESIE